MMKKLFRSALLFFIALQITTFCFAQDEFELVESIPTETTFDHGISGPLEVWLKMINDAKQSIDIETFYFANEKGEPLDEVMTAIRNAASRGVTVRIIVDSSFYSKNDKSVDELNGIENISIFKIPLGNLAGGVMHAKYFIVDDENLFIGSQNMDWRAIKHIHEMGVRVKNKKLAETFREIFNYDVQLCGGVFTNEINSNVVNANNPLVINSDEYGKITLYPAFSPYKLSVFGLNSEEEELLKIIGNAKDRLLIQMYSYSLKARNEKKYYDSIDNALRDAASRGVKIKIIFSDWAIRDDAIDFIKNLSIVPNIEIKFSTIPQYSGGFIPFARVDHCKYFVCDDNISWISTSNWDWGYFYNSRNATLIIDNSKVNEKLSSVFNSVWNSPYVSPVDINKKYEPVKRN